ncbi:SAVED domain-containing protein [Cupriavidus pauculus]|uniref:HNH endonuclease n=1 Tax=Cupriavidus pauculus TaxID=82633 RepID=A0A2N5C332_9BURK|nr:SAVED domain-containing protein [Cupriavidus pauculus]PLP96639.1 HNH endonuclease [Cupriavidus pauculus]
MTTASTLLQASPTTGQSSAAFAGLDDEQLAEWLKQRSKAKKEVVLVHTKTTCKVYEKADARGALQSVDPESKSKTVFKAMAKRERLFIAEISPSEMAGATTAVAAWMLKKASEQEIEALLEQRKVYLGRVDGRGDPITLETANQVWADAGGCCMFEGCGDDLSVVPLYNKGARIAYLAHIIASDPDGPRGTVQDSHRLSNHPENVMLMCDAHHRLIDSFAPELFDAARLSEMRREHAAKVRSYREAMRYPVAQAITLLADLGNVPTHYPDSEFMEALLAEGYSMHSEVKRHLTFRNRDDRTPSDFWGNYLREMELRIGNFVQDICGPRKGAIAVFPVHHTPTLVLGGRIVGEARKVLVFQRSRKRASWLWNRDIAGSPPGTFYVTGLTNSPVDEVLLTVELTAHLNEEAIPDSLLKAVRSGAMPRVRLTTDAPDSECIQRKEDLAQVVDVARKAINSIQDEMRAKRVHLIVLSPVSAAFGIGQLMQPGHHAAFTLYDRPDNQQPFREAFTITGHSVVPPAGSHQNPISIR